MESHTYGLELTETDPQYEQPEKIKIALKPHQRAALYRGRFAEKYGHVSLSIPSNFTEYVRRSGYSYHGNVKVYTNTFVLGDQVGYGKTLTALSIIAATPTKDIFWDPEVVVSSHVPCGQHIGTFRAILDRRRLTHEDKMFYTTLVVVPHGPVYCQWQAAIRQQTELKALFLDTLPSIRRECPPPGADIAVLKEFFERYDVVLLKGTSIKTLMSYYEIPYREHPLNGFARIMIDEAHDLLPKIPMLDFRSLWMISGTYQMLPHRMYSYRGMCSVVREIMNEERMQLALIKGNREFVQRSFDVPPYRELYHLCHLPPQLSMVQPFLHPSVMERINANDIAGAIRELGGTNETEEDIVNLVTRDLQRDIDNKQREINYVGSLEIAQDVRDHRLQILRADLTRFQDKMQALMERVTQLSEKQCAICMDTYANPIMLECTHVFCGGCIIPWMRQSMSRRVCPTCRMPIQCKKLTAIVTERDRTGADTSGANEPPMLNKEEMLLKLLADNPTGRFLVFSRLDSTFWNMTTRLIEANITHAEIKGSTPQMMKILERFRSGELRVILLNTYHAGSGIDISCATDVVIFHSMGLDKTQAVGRAQRVGRTTELRVHNLCYAHEM